MNTKKLFLLGAMLFNLTFCSSDAGSPYYLNGVGYSVVTAGTLLHNGTSVSGSGAILFSAPLSETGSENGYLLTFVLDDEGKVELVTNATSQLNSGVTVRIVRSGSTIDVTTLIGNAITSVLTGFSSANVVPAGSVTLQIDVHNNENPAHILAWDSTVTAPYTTANALFSSTDTEGSGSGTFWGLVLENAVVTAASRVDARFAD